MIFSALSYYQMFTWPSGDASMETGFPAQDASVQPIRHALRCAIEEAPGPLSAGDHRYTKPAAQEAHDATHKHNR